MRESLTRVTTSYSYALVPTGFGMWLAHYGGFHFLSGALSIIPVVQNLLTDLGTPVLGSSQWTLGPIVPTAWLIPIEIAFLEGGWLGSVLVAHRISIRELGSSNRAQRALFPWAVLSTVLLAIAIWLMLQPMEMRGTFLGAG